MTKDVKWKYSHFRYTIHFELLQLKNVTNTTDFTAATVPSKETVEYYINEAQAYIDMNTRKSWRPNYVVD